MKELWTGQQPIWILVMAFLVSNCLTLSKSFLFLSHGFPFQLVDNEMILLKKGHKAMYVQVSYELKST